MNVNHGFDHALNFGRGVLMHCTGNPGIAPQYNNSPLPRPNHGTVERYRTAKRVHRFPVPVLWSYDSRIPFTMIAPSFGLSVLFFSSPSFSLPLQLLFLAISLVFLLSLTFVLHFSYFNLNFSLFPVSLSSVLDPCVSVISCRAPVGSCLRALVSY